MQQNFLTEVFGTCGKVHRTFGVREDTEGEGARQMQDALVTDSVITNVIDDDREIGRFGARAKRK